MKKYDYEKCKQFIEGHKESIKEVTLGMHEDWAWTAETVWEDGEYTKALKDGTEIAGIDGSFWATPVMDIEFKDGTSKTISCFKGESDDEKPIWFKLGSLSAPCQEARENIEVEE